MPDQSDDLKPLLLEVLRTVQTIKADHEKRFDRLEERFDRINGRLDRMVGRSGELTSEQTLIKEIGRLDGRIDQLTLELTLGRRGAA